IGAIYSFSMDSAARLTKPNESWKQWSQVRLNLASMQDLPAEQRVKALRLHDQAVEDRFFVNACFSEIQGNQGEVSESLEIVGSQIKATYRVALIRFLACLKRGRLRSTLRLVLRVARVLSHQGILFVLFRKPRCQRMVDHFLRQLGKDQAERLRWEDTPDARPNNDSNARVQPSESRRTSPLCA